MSRTVCYLIIIARSTDEYVAYAPAFPRLVAKASSARRAYTSIKSILRARMLALVAGGIAPPTDPVVQTRTLRLDVWYLRQQEELQ
jgi:hypothetical protein